LPSIIKIDPYNFELYRFKVGLLFDTLYSLLNFCDQLFSRICWGPEIREIKVTWKFLVLQ